MEEKQEKQVEFKAATYNNVLAEFTYNGNHYELSMQLAGFKNKPEYTLHIMENTPITEDYEPTVHLSISDKKFQVMYDTFQTFYELVVPLEVRGDGSFEHPRVAGDDFLSENPFEPNFILHERNELRNLLMNS